MLASTRPASRSAPDGRLFRTRRKRYYSQQERTQYYYYSEEEQLVKMLCYRSLKKVDFTAMFFAKFLHSDNSD